MFDLGKFGVTVELDTSQFDSGMTSIDNKTKKASGGLGSFTKSVGKIAAGLGVFTLVSKGVDMVKNSLDGAIDRYDTLNNFPKVMQQIGFDAETSQGAIDKLSDGIQGLPTRLDEVASTAQSIAIMTGDLDGAVETTLALNNAFLASGASTADAERGLQQYTQMLSKGEVDLQSWRTLQETMPYALRETAEAFGYTGESATLDFYEALKSGDVTMSEFNSKLIELDQAQGGFAETAQEASAGIKTAWTNMQTWVVMGVAKIITALDEAFGGVGSIEGMINSLKPVFDATFTFIADMIVKAGDGMRFLKEKFDESKPAIDNLFNAMQPLLDVFKQTYQNIQSQLIPTWENLKNLFDSLMPIIELLAAAVGVTLMAVIITATSAWNGMYNAIMPIANALINLVDVVVNVVNSIIAVLTGDWEGALQYWNDATESSVEFFMNLWDAVIGFFTGFVDTLIGWFEFLYEVITGDSIDFVETMKEWFMNLWESTTEIVGNLVDTVVEFFTDMYVQASEILNTFLEIINSIWEFIKQTFSNALQFIIALVTGDFTAMREIMQNQMDNAKNLLSNIWENIKSLIGEKASAILQNIIDKFIQIKDNMQNKIEEAKQAVINKFTEIVSNVTTKASEIVSNVQQKFSEIKDKMTKPIEDAKAKIGSIVDDIKGFFSNMKLKIPKIELPKMPKFSLSGKFSLKPPSVPKIGVNWNAQGGIFKNPTIFNTKNAGLQGVGEAGAEAIIPLRSSVLAGIGKGISKTMGDNSQSITFNPTINFHVNENQKFDKKLAEKYAEYTFNSLNSGLKNKGVQFR